MANLWTPIQHYLKNGGDDKWEKRWESGGLINKIRLLRLNIKILDLVKKGFVTDIENFSSFGSVPNCFFKNVRDELFFDPIRSLFPDFL